MPQIFLYEEGRNSFLVIDGQQRLMSLYYFIKERLPRKEKRPELRNNSAEQDKYLEGLFPSFLSACSALSQDAFLNKGNKRFSISLFEAVFTAACASAFEKRQAIAGKNAPDSIAELDADPQFQRASNVGMTASSNVTMRLKRAREIIRIG